MRSRRIKPVATHADQVQEQAVQVYVAAQQLVVDAQLQLKQLIEYRTEYSSNRGSNDTNATQLRDYQLFLQKINRSIEQSKTNIEHQKQLCEQQKLNWLKTRSRSKALEAVIKKYQLSEAKIEARIEQKEQDEHASRMSRHVNKN
ncbi:MAG TPA: flagellar export protein FliJ [Gammaproteobacteria bacterium]|nr:flagellar export protein FliJ [Gammaproteobacteria bacterium]